MDNHKNVTVCPIGNHSVFLGQSPLMDFRVNRKNTIIKINLSKQGSNQCNNGWQAVEATALAAVTAATRQDKTQSGRC